MFKRIGALALILAGSMAVFTPAVAQARDRDDYRHDRREWRDDHRGRNDYARREWRGDDRREWREHERWERRDYRPFYYDRFGRLCYR